jgi:hypothetical protein
VLTNTVRKIRTSYITSLINAHVDANYILAEEQKHCKTGATGREEQPVIIGVMLQPAHTKRRNQYVRYMTKTAADPVPHSWLLLTYLLHGAESFLRSYPVFK